MEGMEHLLEDRFAHAVAAFEASLRIQPGDPEVLEGLTQALIRLDRLDDALEAAKKWAEATPDAVLPHTNLSIIYQKKGMTKEAEHEGALARTKSWTQEIREEKVRSAQTKT